MSSVEFSAFLPEVMQYVPEVPEPVAENAIRQSCIEFCEKTRFWQEDVDPIYTVAEVPSYAVDTPYHAKFVDIVGAWYGTQFLIPKTAEELARIYRWTDWRTVKGNPAYITRISPTEVVLVPMPLQDGVMLNIRAAFAPQRSSTSVGADVYEEYLEAVGYGARARLYNTPQQPYFDKKSAIEFDSRFRRAITDARVRVNRALTRASGRIEFQRFI